MYINVRYLTFIYEKQAFFLLKLQKQLSRKLGSTEYPKWVVVIPPEKIQELGWEEGIELDMALKDNKLVIKPKR